MPNTPNPENPSKNKILNYFLIQGTREWPKNHPRACGFFHTKSQAENSYGELNQAKLDFWPGQDDLARSPCEIVNHPAYLEI